MDSVVSTGPAAAPLGPEAAAALTTLLPTAPRTLPKPSLGSAWERSASRTMRNARLRVTAFSELMDPLNYRRKNRNRIRGMKRPRKYMSCAVTDCLSRTRETRNHCTLQFSVRPVVVPMHSESARISRVGQPAPDSPAQVHLGIAMPTAPGESHWRVLGPRGAPPRHPASAQPPPSSCSPGLAAMGGYTEHSTLG